MTQSTLFPTAIFFAAITALAGCASSPDARLYILKSMDSAAPPAPDENDLSIFVGPVALPDYLKRDEIVFRSGGHRVSVAEYDRWAEALDRNVTTVITANLAAQFGADKVIDYYANFSSTPDLTVRVRVLEFGPATENMVALEAVWELEDRRDSLTNLYTKKIEQPIRGDGVPAAVEAMSAALNDLSIDIADSIKLQQARP